MKILSHFGAFLDKFKASTQVNNDIKPVKDNSEHNEIERSNNQHEGNYREIFNNSIDAIFIHNAETGKVEDVNETMLRMYRCTYKEAILCDIEGFSTNEPLYNKNNAFIKIKAARKNGINQFEWQARRRDGTSFWAEVVLKLIRLNGEEKIMAVIRDIDDKKNTEAQIKFHNDFEKLIFDISSTFIELQHNEVDDGLNNALEKISKLNNADLAYFYFFKNEKINSKVSYFWHNEKINIDRKVFQNIDFSSLKWHTNQMLSNQNVIVKSIEILPQEAAPFKEFIKAQQINSFLSVPMNYQGKTIGFLGLATNSIYREWNDDEVWLLQATGQTFINNIIRKNSLEALKESEQTHREIFNATTEAIIVIDSEKLIFIDVNQAMLEMFGYTYNEAIGLHIKSFVLETGPFTLEDATRIFQKVLSEGPQVFEWLTKKKDGTLFWVEVSLRSAKIKDGKRILSVVRDITERKNTEEYIRKNEEKYRLLVEGQTDLVIKYNTNKNLLFVSPSFCDLFNKSENELIGSSVMQLIHPADQTVTLSVLELLNNPPYICYLEHKALTKNGWRCIAWNNKAVLDNDNKLYEIIAVGRDITYQKEIEDALRRSEDRFRTIVQQLSDIVFIIDKNSIFLYDTPSVKKILGYEDGELIGKTGLDYVHPDDIAIVKVKLNEVLHNSKQFVHHEFRLKHADGRWISVEAIGINMFQHPSINGLVVTCRDITERKLIESRILDAIIKTEEHERERFAKNLHDDLGPLLSSIKMYINSFTTASEKTKQEYIINQLNEIVKEAITTTKEVSNDLSPHILINYGLISAIESFLNKVPSSIKVLFENELISGRLSIHVENSTYRIVKELINNSLKHSMANTVKIKLTEHNNFLHLYYSDNGIGFDMSELTVNKSKGMGFSNIISRAKALNGVYEINTKPKKGFVFKIKIPINQSSE